MCGEIDDSDQHYMKTQLFIHHNLIKTQDPCTPYVATIP